MRGGAPLSKTLAQLLLFRSATSLLLQKESRDIKWASSIKLSAYLAVINEAYELYGDSISLQQPQRDEDIIEKWLQRSAAPAEVPLNISTLLSDFKIMPLPLRIGYSGTQVIESRSKRAEDALIHAPCLAPLYLANGEHAAPSPLSQLLTHSPSLANSGYQESLESSLYISQVLLQHQFDSSARIAERLQVRDLIHSTPWRTFR